MADMSMKIAQTNKLKHLEEDMAEKNKKVVLAAPKTSTALNQQQVDGWQPVHTAFVQF